MKLLGISMVAYGFLKGSFYRKSDSKTGRRLGLFIAAFYICVGVAMFFVSK